MEKLKASWEIFCPEDENLAVETELKSVFMKTERIKIPGIIVQYWKAKVDEDNMINLSCTDSFCAYSLNDPRLVDYRRECASDYYLTAGRHPICESYNKKKATCFVDEFEEDPRMITAGIKGTMLIPIGDPLDNGVLGVIELSSNCKLRHLRKLFGRVMQVVGNSYILPSTDRVTSKLDKSVSAETAAEIASFKEKKHMLTREYFKEKVIKRSKSVDDMAKESGFSSNTIRRELAKKGFPLPSMKDASDEAIKIYKDKKDASLYFALSYAESIKEQAGDHRKNLGVKVKFSNLTSKCTSGRYNRIVEAVAKTFPHEVGTFTLRYIEDGKEFKMTCDEEVQDAIDFAFSHHLDKVNGLIFPAAFLSEDIPPTPIQAWQEFEES